VVDDLVRVGGQTQARPARAGLLTGLRPPDRRAERRAGAAGPSAEGGCEEFREFRPSCRLRSTTSDCSSSTRTCSCAIVRACASTNATSSSRDGTPDPDTPHDQHSSAATSRHPDLNGYLSRENDTTWVFCLTYLKEPPSEDVVDQTLTDIRAAARQLGFTIEDVVRQSRDTQHDGN